MKQRAQAEMYLLRGMAEVAYIIADKSKRGLKMTSRGANFIFLV